MAWALLKGLGFTWEAVLSQRAVTISLNSFFLPSAYFSHKLELKKTLKREATKIAN